MGARSLWSDCKNDLAPMLTRVEAVQQRWPRDIIPKTILSTYDAMPFLFREAFPTVTSPQLTDLALFCRLFAQSIFLQDKFIDDPTSRPAADQLRVLALQAESYQILHSLFPQDSPFWSQFRSYLVEHIEACLLERDFVEGRRPLQDFSEPLGLQITLGKNGLVRTVVAALCHLSGDHEPLLPLVHALEGWNIAAQMLDDLQDYRQDFALSVPSVLIARAFPERTWPTDADERQRVLKKLSVHLYYAGHATYVLDVATHALDRVEALRARWPDLGFYRVVAQLRERCECLRRDIDQMTQDNKRRSQVDRPAIPPLPQGRDAIDRLAFSSLGFVLQQWQRGFGDLRDLARFPAAVGFGSQETCYAADVFYRAVAADALCDADEVLDGRLADIIASENAYLLSRRLPYGVGGWNYYIDLPEIPADADAVAQVMQVLMRTDQRPLVAQLCEIPIEVLFRDNAYPDGSFQTWIVPAVNRSPLEERQAECVSKYWSPLPDEGVMANLLYALQCYAPVQYNEEIQRGITCLVDRQKEDGSWRGIWYVGNRYTDYVCLRFLVEAAPDSPAIARAAAFVRASQLPDGGFGGHDEAMSNPLNTALALLALAAVHPLYPDPADERRVAAAVEYLGCKREFGGGFASAPFVHVATDTYTYGSRTLTTTYVMKALFAWKALFEASRQARDPA